MTLWPNFRSPLIWDVFAVSTYATVSVLFWYVGLIPDLATMRDKAKSLFVRRIFGIVALGWRGSAMHWQRYETASLLLAGLATPLVLSVHTVVSFDFAVAVVPGWHSTIFPPYFVAGAIYSGFAMVLTLVIPIRAYYGLEGFVTMRHIQNMAKIMLVTGLIVFYGYATEAFFGWYAANEYEGFMIHNRMFGPYWCGVLDTHLLQRRHAADAVVQEGPDEHSAALPDLARRERRHVARALRHRRHQPEPRLPALVVGHVCGHGLGLGDVRRHPGPVRVAHVPLPTVRADDFDVRDADDRAGGGKSRRSTDYGACMHALMTDPLFGLMAEFESATAIVAAARKTREAGYRKVDAYSPFPIEELDEALKLPRNRVPLTTLIGGLTGLAARVLALEYWASVIAYPLNIGGRPFHSLPAFIVPAYETTILFAAFGAVVGMIALNGLPMPYHPVFNVPAFEGATSRQVLPDASRRRTAKFELQGTREFLRGLHPVGVSDIAS